MVSKLSDLPARFPQVDSALRHVWGCWRQSHPRVTNNLVYTCHSISEDCQLISGVWSSSLQAIGLWSLCKQWKPSTRTCAEKMNKVATTDFVKYYIWLKTYAVTLSVSGPHGKPTALCQPSTPTPFLYVCLFWYIINPHQDNVQNSHGQKERCLATQP